MAIILPIGQWYAPSAVVRRWLSGLVIMMQGWDIQLILQVRFFSFMYNICHLIFDFRFVKSSSHMVRDWTETGSKAGTSSASTRSKVIILTTHLILSVVIERISS